MRKGNILLIVLVVAGILAASVGGYFWWSSYVKTPRTSSLPSSPQTVCGTITGIHCPTGYRCQLENGYPDAGGKCVKLGGIFGKVTLGPTCPVQRVGENCTAPFVGTVVVGKQVGPDKSGRFEEATQFQTKSDGSFRVFLPPGDYIAKRHNDQDYWKTSKTLIHVTGEEFTNVDITFDTGIR